MKKVLTMLLALMMLLTMVGCGKNSEDQLESSIVVGREVVYDDFIQAFEMNMQDVKDIYNWTYLPEVELEEGEIVQPIVISDILELTSFDMRITYGESGKIVRIFFTTDIIHYGSADMTLLTYYVYDSMGFEEMSIDDFLAIHAVDVEEITDYRDEEGWNITTKTVTDTVTFAITPIVF